jgi:hypothetical protein
VILITADEETGGRLGVQYLIENIAWLRLRTTGTAAHGPQPILDNANLILLRAIEKALNVPASSKPHETVANMQRSLGGMAKNKYTAAIQGNTISRTYSGR